MRSRHRPAINPSDIQPGPIELVRRQFTQSQPHFGQFNTVFEHIAQKLDERLALLAIQPATILDLGARNGYMQSRLKTRYPNAQLLQIDPAGMPLEKPGKWWQKRVKPSPYVMSADPHQLPLPDESIDLVVSNLLLPWCHAPQAVFNEVIRVLATDGAFMFSSAGPDTLQEYAEVWRSVDSATHVYGLSDMHDVGDAMMAAGFAAPVLDRGNLTVDYPNIDSLQSELRNLGAANIAHGRRRGLMASGVRNKLRKNAPKGRMTVTLELVQGHGWKGALKSAGNNSDEPYSVSVDSLRAALRGKGS